jgi:putative tricarboxylic transport membrane protein
MKRAARIRGRERILLGLGLLALAGILAWQTTLIPAGGEYARVGPSVAPWLVTALLALLGIAFIGAELLGRGVALPVHGKADRPALLWVAGALLLNLALIDSAGFIVAATVLFAVTARGFGSLRPIRDTSVGLMLASSAYLAFDRLLGYRIGSGLIEQFL